MTRRQLLEELDRPVLKPLPTQPYVVAEWRVRRVGIHYHVDVESRIYSVPIAARAARSKWGSPAAPWRSSSRASGSPCTCDRAGTASTQLPPTTCPPVIAVTSTEPLAAFAGMLPSLGPATAALCDLVLEQRPHPEWGTGPRATSCRNTGRHHLGMLGRGDWASILRSVAKAEPEIGSSDT